MTLKYIDLSERHGHRGDHGFDCGAEFDVKMHGRRVHIPDFVRSPLALHLFSSETASCTFLISAAP